MLFSRRSWIKQRVIVGQPQRLAGCAQGAGGWKEGKGQAQTRGARREAKGTRSRTGSTAADTRVAGGAARSPPSRARPQGLTAQLGASASSREVREEMQQHCGDVAEGASPHPKQQPRGPLTGTALPDPAVGSPALKAACYRLFPLNSSLCPVISGRNLQFSYK